MVMNESALENGNETERSYAFSIGHRESQKSVSLSGEDLIFSGPSIQNSIPLLVLLLYRSNRQSRNLC